MGFVVKIVKKINQDMHFSQKFIGSIICLVIIPLIFLTLVFYFKFQQIIENEVGASYEQVVNQYVNKIENKFTIYKNLLDTISVNGVVQDIFSRQDEIKVNNTIDIGRKFSREIDNQIFAKNTKEIYNIMLYALNRDFPSDGLHTSNVDLVKNEYWYKEMKTSKENTTYIYYPINSLAIDIVSLIKPIPNLIGEKYTKEMGYVKIDLMAKSVFSMGDQNNIRDGYSVYIISREGNILFSNTNEEFPMKAHEEIQGIVNAGSGRLPLYKANNNSILIYKKIAGCNWTACVIFHSNELESKVMEIGLFILFIVGLMLIVLIGLTFLFSRIFTKRTNLFIDKIKKIEKGEFDVTPEIEGKDEIGIIDEHFNRMVRRLNELINENYIQRIEKKEAELRALQFQINPHFLYNTLESISAMASVNGCREICAISEKLGMMFRYNINKERSEFATLIQEIQHIQNYFYIQSVRFENAFTSIVDIPDELKKCKIPRFILQPIVENAIYHGFSYRKGKGCIEISACIEDHGLNINVYDDGSGMTPEQLEKLNWYINETDNRLVEGNREGIGIRNVNVRIKFLYGTEYGIIIKSRFGAGTQVKIVLPLYYDFGR